MGEAMKDRFAERHKRIEKKTAESNQRTRAHVDTYTHSYTYAHTRTKIAYTICMASALVYYLQWQLLCVSRYSISTSSSSLSSCVLILPLLLSFTFCSLLSILPPFLASLYPLFFIFFGFHLLALISSSFTSLAHLS